MPSLTSSMSPSTVRRRDSHRSSTGCYVRRAHRPKAVLTPLRRPVCALLPGPDRSVAATSKVDQNCQDYGAWPTNEAMGQRTGRAA